MLYRATEQSVKSLEREVSPYDIKMTRWFYTILLFILNYDKLLFGYIIL